MIHQAAVYPVVVVVSDEPVNLSESFLKAGEAVTLVTFTLNDAVERFNIRILIRRLDRDLLVLDSRLHAELAKGVAVKLRPVVGTDDEPGFLLVYATLQQCLVQRLDDAFRIACFPSVVSHDGTVEHVNDAGQVEVPPHARNIAVLDVHLPQLVRAGYFPIVHNPAWDTAGLAEPGPQNAHLFAQAVDLLLVDEQLKPSAQKHGDLAIAESGIRPLQDAANEAFDPDV